MKNTDVVINGFSASVIKHLIEMLKRKSIECYNNAAKVYNEPAKNGLKTFSNENALLIQMLAKWATISAPREFKTADELGNFLLKAETILTLLTPAE